MCGSGVQNTGFCGAESGVCAVLQAFSFSLGALRHKDTSPYSLGRPKRHKANESAENQAPRFLSHMGAVPGKLPMLISKRKDPALAAPPHHTHLDRELNPTKQKEKAVQVLLGLLSFQLRVSLFFELLPSPLNSTLKGSILEEVELLWETYQIGSGDINHQLNSLNF